MAVFFRYIRVRERPTLSGIFQPWFFEVVADFSATVGFKVMMNGQEDCVLIDSSAERNIVRPGFLLYFVESTKVRADHFDNTKTAARTARRCVGTLMF